MSENQLLNCGMFETWNEIMLTVALSITLDVTVVFTNLCNPVLDTCTCAHCLQDVLLVGCRYRIDWGSVEESYPHLLCIKGSTTRQ